jgi:multiple sugar transport system substrate-binding protein
MVLRGCKMATIKDVAKTAGVSIATVSYYLNKKRVSEKTAKKVADAIKELNYIASSSGRTLRAREKNIGIVFPNIKDPYLEKIFHGIKGYFQYHEIPFFFELSDDNPEKELSIITDFIGKRVSGIILYSCQSQDFTMLDTIEKNEIPYVLIDRKPENYDGNFIGCDNYELCRKLTTGFISKGYSNLLLVTGPEQFQENKVASQAFLECCKEAKEDISYTYLQTKPVREGGFRIMFDFFQTSAEIPQVILTTSYKLAEGIRYALELNKISVKSSMLLVSSGDSVDDVFYHDTSILKTSRNAFKIGETTARLLLKNCDSPKIFEPEQIIVKDPEDNLRIPPLSPYIGKSTIISTEFEKSLTVLLIDDNDSVHSLQSLLVDFQVREHIKIKIKKILPELLYDFLIKNIHDPDSDIDIFLFDLPWLEYLAHHNYLMPLNDFIQTNQEAFRHFIPGILETYGKVDDTYYALPYMCSTQLLFYRKDLFSDKFLNRKFEEQYKLPLEPPKNWAYYKSICEFFTKSINPYSPTNYGHAMDLAYTEEGLGSFYPRLWAANETLFTRQGKPKFNTLGARSAIRNILQCTSYAHPDYFSDRPINTLEKLIQGEVVMAITYYNYATTLVNKADPSCIGKIGWASIPGNNPVLGGWSFGINPSCKNPEEAMKFISWASCKELAVAHTILGGQSPSQGTYQNYDILSLYPWLSKAVSSLSTAKKRKIPSAASERGYSENIVEDVLFSHISNLIQEAEGGVEIDSYQIEKALTKAEKELEARCES